MTLTNFHYIERALRRRLEQHPRIRADAIDAILRHAVNVVPVSVRSGGVNGGAGVKTEHADAFIANVVLRRPGWTVDGEAEPTTTAPSAGSSEFSSAAFNELSPLERLKFANRGVRRDDKGNVHVVVDAPR